MRAMSLIGLKKSGNLKRTLALFYEFRETLPKH